MFFAGFFYIDPWVPGAPWGAPGGSTMQIEMIFSKISNLPIYIYIYIYKITIL